jgi:hypothetical protein
MVIDYNRFTPGSPPAPGTLTMLDQIPGFVVAWDATPRLVRRTCRRHRCRRRRRVVPPLPLEEGGAA